MYPSSLQYPNHHVPVVSIRLDSCRRILAMRNVLDSTVLINMDIQPLGLEVHCFHRVGLENAVFLGEIGFCERLDTSIVSLPYSKQGGGVWGSR